MRHRPFLLAGVILVGAAVITGSRQATAEEAPLPVRLVEGLRGIFGEHHARAAHAKGLLLDGTFEADPAAAGVSTAAFLKGSAPVLVRFSDTTGLPEIPDNDPGADPRGMAVKVFVSETQTVDIVCHSYNGFPVRTAEELAQFFEAVLASGADAPKPTALDTFLAARPAAVRFLSEQGPPPESFATTTFFCVNAYALTDADGTVRHVRYRLVPEAGDRRLTPEAAAEMGADYLMDDIAARVGARPVRFRWMAQVAGDGDVIDDPSTPWPEEREMVTLGTVSVDALVADQAGTDARTVFLPTAVVPGIAPADPMLALRAAAYGVSFGGRR